ncbi:hypothetical protein ACJ41O_005772 [Fusarium nematophilum]
MPNPTFTITARAADTDIIGKVLVLPTQPSSEGRLMDRNNIPAPIAPGAPWVYTQFTVEETSGRIIPAEAGGSRALCGTSTLPDGSRADPVPLKPCYKSAATDSNAVTCTVQASGELDCQIATAHGPYKYFSVDENSPYYVFIGSEQHHQGRLALTLVTTPIASG